MATTARDPETRTLRMGIIGTVLLVAIALLALNFTVFSNLWIGTGYTASFTEAGGITPGDSVIISGVEVGKVRSVSLAGDHVDVSFGIDTDNVPLGDQTGAAIVAQTALGKKALSVNPAGGGQLESGATIPVQRTTPPYDITDALNQLTQNIQGINAGKLAQSLSTVADVLRTAAPEVRPALDGVGRLSDVINKRDTELSQLLTHTASVTGVLSDRRAQIQTLFSDGTLLLGELNRRSADLAALLRNATVLAGQVQGLIDENRAQLKPTLDQLTTLLQTLQNNKANVDKALNTAGPLLRELGEVVSGFPGFNVYIPNLLPTNLVPTLPQLLSGGGVK